MSTDDVQKKFEDMKLSQRVILYLKRVLAWLVWIAITGSFVYLILYLSKLSGQTSTDDRCPDFNNLVSNSNLDDAVNAAICYIKKYSQTFTITIANLLIPIIFSYIVTFEEYSPKTRMIVDLIRSIIFRISGLFVLMIGFIGDNK